MGLSKKDTKKLSKASALDQSKDPKDWDSARARRTEIDYKDLLRQINSKRKPMKPAVSKIKESFEIDKSAHKSAQKKAKLRNLAKGNTNPNEKAAAEKKAGGPKLYGEGKTFDAWKKAAASALGRKKKQEKKPSMDSTTRKLHKWRTDKEQAEREKYVTFTKPVEDD